MQLNGARCVTRNGQYEKGLFVPVIKSFADQETEKVFRRRHSKKLPEDIQRRAREKLQTLKRAQDLTDLRALPGNRLEKLRGDREGQWSIRINQQWRLCFRWHENDAYDAEIVDYH